MITHVPVSGSSNVFSVGYDGASKTMEVRFKDKAEDPGDLYRYEDVSPEKYQALMASPSKGKHIHTSIKGAHKHSKVPE